MIYYHHEQKEKMLSNPCNKKLDAVLQKNFPENDKWGGCAYFDGEKNLEFVEICTLTKITTNKTKWTHFATIGKADDGTWEVYTQFNGKNQNELWVYGYYKHFKGACHSCASDSFQKGIRKPIKVFE